MSSQLLLVEAVGGLHGADVDSRLRVPAVGVVTNSLPAILQSFDDEHETDDFLNLCATGTIQASAVSGVVVPAIVCREFVAVRRRMNVPQTNAQRFLHQ
jgi:hypothetical protein